MLEARGCRRAVRRPVGPRGAAAKASNLVGSQDSPADTVPSCPRGLGWPRPSPTSISSPPCAPARPPNSPDPVRPCRPCVV